MSYYILPKNNMNIQIKHTINNTEVPLYTSFSIHNYYNKSYQQLENITQMNDNSFNNIEKLLSEFHTHEYIYACVPGTKFSVSKLKTNSKFFYELFEILITLNCFDWFGNNMPIRFLHIGDNYLDSVTCFDILRENKNDILLHTSKYEAVSASEKIDLLFYETNDAEFTDLNSYVLYLIDIVMIIMKQQKENGTTIIKMNYIFHKPVIDILYILSSMFEKSYIVKPNATNIITFNKYLVCKHFLLHEPREKKIYMQYYNKLNNIKNEYHYYENTNKTETTNIHSIIDGEIPYYFINKIDDINIIIGQQQLEYICQIINVFKNGNKNEKIEFMKKNNIQKSVNWCEKFKIPCNKFLDKTNIFYI